MMRKSTSPQSSPRPLYLVDSTTKTTRKTKLHSRSCGDTVRLYLLIKPQFMVRMVLFGVAAVGSLSLATRLHTLNVTLTESESPQHDGPRVLSQPPPPLLSPPQLPSPLSLWSDAGYETKPRVVGYYWPSDYDDWDEASDTQSTTRTKPKKNHRVLIGYEPLDPNLVRPLNSDRSIYVSTASNKAQVRLENSQSYDDNLRDDFEPGDCEAQYDWQRHSFPTCNTLHEVALQEMRVPHAKHSRVKFLANGYWRDVWQIRETAKAEPVALKTIRYQHDITADRNFDRHRRDAVAMERMTSSPNVVNIYSFCGNSGIFQFASGGSLEDALFYSDEPPWNATENLIVAYQATSGLADLHNVDREGRASIAHTDITPSQFVFVNSFGRFLLNDFNRCRFISWDTKLDKTCGFHVGSNPGTFRSPEEYRYDLETEKVDVYSLGNIFYALMMKQYPYEHPKMDKKEAQKRIMKGERPPLSDEWANSTDPFTIALIKAMHMCWIDPPEQRASSREVEQFLDAELTRLGVNGKDSR